MGPAGAKALSRMMRSAEAAVTVVAHRVLEKTLPDVPVLPEDQVRKGTQASGALKDSGKVEVSEDPRGYTATISFSGPHAKKQHENMRLKHPHGGTAKFLSKHTRDRHALNGEIAEEMRRMNR